MHTVINQPNGSLFAPTECDSFLAGWITHSRCFKAHNGSVKVSLNLAAVSQTTSAGFYGLSCLYGLSKNAPDFVVVIVTTSCHSYQDTHYYTLVWQLDFSLLPYKMESETTTKTVHKKYKGALVSEQDVNLSHSQLLWVVHL